MSEFGYGYQGPSDAASDYNFLAFVINQILGRVRTCALVKVVSAPYGGGGVAPVGFVDAAPIVNMVDGLGNSQAHGTIYRLPYFRLQGGVTGAVICDPKVGDIGLAIICDRDISSAKQARGQANPGSWRRFNLADGVYLGGTLNGTPTTYVEFDGNGGVVINATGSVTVNAGTTATVNAKDAVVYGTHSYSWDIYGYGQRVTYTGGVNYQVDEYFNGAVVTTTDHGLHQPEIPPP